MPEPAPVTTTACPANKSGRKTELYLLAFVIAVPVSMGMPHDRIVGDLLQTHRPRARLDQVLQSADISHVRVDDFIESVIVIVV